MTELQIFAFFILPLSIAAVGLVGAYFAGRPRKTPPAE
jgi:hypothetical protein